MNKSSVNEREVRILTTIGMIRSGMVGSALVAHISENFNISLRMARIYRDWAWCRLRMNVDVDVDDVRIFIMNKYLAKASSPDVRESFPALRGLERLYGLDRAQMKDEEERVTLDQVLKFMAESTSSGF